MKKILLIARCLFLFLLFSCSDETEVLMKVDDNEDFFINANKAKEIGEKMFTRNQAKGFDGKTLKESFPVKDEEGNIVYYINNYNEGGFVILAADTRSLPVLAYSFDNNFSTNLDDYPAGLIDWLVFAKDQIKEIRTKKLPQPDEFSEIWQQAEIGNVRIDYETINPCSSIPVTQTIKEPLLQTSWHQRNGFNDLAPLAVPQYCSSINSGNNRFYAGCVPIAIAQVMRYHQFPTNFSYANMHNTSGTQAARLLVNHLHNKIYYFYDQFNFPIPPSRPLTYSCDGTGVNSAFPVHTMLTLNYGYASANDHNSIFIPQEFNLYSDIINNLPVLVSGGKAEGWWIFKKRVNGHMWVADGVDKASFCIRILGTPHNFEVLRYHMNWGWGGGSSSLNGFYSYGNFNPGTNDFNYQVDLVYNIQKP